MPTPTWPYIDADRRNRIDALCAHSDDYLAPVVKELLGYLDIVPPPPETPASTLEVSRAKAEVEKVRAEMRELERDYAARGYGNTITNQQARIAELEPQLTALAADRDQHKNALQPYREEVRKLTDQLRDTTSALDSTRDELAKITAVRDDLYGQLNPRHLRARTDSP